MCILLNASIPRLLEPFIAEVIPVLELSRARHGPDAAVLSLVGCEQEDLGRQTHYSGSLRIQDIQQGVVRELQSPRTWSPETLNNIRSWLKTCTVSHSNCARTWQVSKLPLRLIDVMPAGSSHAAPVGEISLQEFNFLSLEELPQLQIVSSVGLSQDTSYLTLSHRWGYPPSVLLNKENLFLLRGDISRHLLDCTEAAVFRHAIHVTRGLGFRYIWIDALCIMQDDEAEKQAEIMRMDEIYSNSTLNIAATEGKIGEGLIFDRSTLHINPYKATVRTSESRDIRLQVYPDISYLRQSDGPLNQRGWVFQERTLSRRVCHFTKNQVFWECRSLESSEILPQGIPGSRIQCLKLSLSSSLQQPSSMQHSLSAERTKQIWYELVDFYSRTSLTFPNDRLLAISGLARRFCFAMNLDPTQYLAGMWRDDLPQSLLWSERIDSIEPTTAIESTLAKTTEMKNAPSWSWASLLAPTSSIEFFNFEATAEILNVHITRVSRNYFDGASTCLLRLRGSLCKCHRDFQDEAPWVYVDQYPVFQEFNSFTFQQGKAIILEWDFSRSAISNALGANNSISARFTYYLLHIASENSPEGRMERGVILRRTASHGTYVRVGSFFTPFRGQYSGSELEKAFTGRLDTLNPDDYFEFHDGKYAVDIV
ncbi:heterokaryon incompatibility protein-domain-containing protein [Xylaria flabelliformis]|nr:heterokaryon incompatibility protein-domain-containing protein [Xylaria flabelliformis]